MKSETETGAGPRETTAALRERVTEALGRGLHPCKGKAESEFSFTIKAEELDPDDLASLCGGVNGLDVRSATGSNYASSVAGSEYQLIASGSNCHGRY